MKRFYSLMFVSLLLLAAGCSGLSNETGNESTPADNDSQQESPEKHEQEGESNEAGEKGKKKQNESKGSNNKKDDNDNKEKDTADKPASGKGDEVVTVDEPHALTVVVNKSRKLPEDFEPNDLVVPDVPFPFDEFHEKKQMRLEAAEALEELFKGAKQDGVELVAASGYRSYERQKLIYEDNVKKNGEEHANQFSAKPGTSEHQTGLAMDVTSAAAAFKLDQDFIETKEGQWLADHGHEYGFIIRYPEGKSDITGYAYEPWHLRYVGKEPAAEIHQQEETLEEFFGLYP
ncbi:putative carboxypeptidase YodJ [Thalassobacillus devorans]|uniref:Carboxypeptidase YodJ n=1 Tax=Thalassobacillus devorans TaxID=279813 RepID=A0ABQ1NDR2_9BACI|nr:M15 family metallopeptidase [Thalassobacillus devorans]NIK26944.1 D-alanyl-D-alanine carboxypeptidase [Thalassobacillus devorans]GGC73641.1 putative carboxypeptidase YodJ [Thalassobacillus devorans]